MKRHLLLVSIALALGAGAAAAYADNPMQIWGRCIEAAADRFAPQPETAAVIVEAALATCNKEAEALVQAAIDQAARQMASEGKPAWSIAKAAAEVKVGALEAVHKGGTQRLLARVLAWRAAHGSDPRGR